MRTKHPGAPSAEAQRTAPGRYFRVNGKGEETGASWIRPDRGTWRWSWYNHTRGEEYWAGEIEQAEMRVEEALLRELHLLTDGARTTIPPVGRE